MPWGCDFTFAAAGLNYDQMDKLIQYVNKYNTNNITLMYSTPSQYIDAVKKENIKWPTKYDDGFPYSDAAGDFWSGFYSTRPSKKKQVRDLQANLHASQKLFARKVLQANTTDEEVKKILHIKDEYLSALGVYHHHNAITGTNTRQVADDFSQRAH